MDGLAVMVLLRHDLTDGTHHFDWLLENPQDPKGPLIAFRIDRRIDQPRRGPFDAVRMTDHRRHYLTYEGEVSGGRGRVSRVATGQCRVTAASPAALQLDMTFGGGWCRWSGEQGEGDRWTFVPTQASRG